jgi:formamidopyrimidine-DNA glycosylase
MPELPDITIYVEALERRVLNETVEGVRLASPFLLRSFDPPIGEAAGKRVIALRRLGKRIVFCLEGEMFFVLHLMIAGRLHWKPRKTKITGKVGLGAIDFSSGTLLITEASSKKRASLHLIRGEAALAEHQRGGVEVLDATLEEFSNALTCENHTLKRALTDPRLFSGIGNAYSDEILHRAKLSPVKKTNSLSSAEIQRLFSATQDSMREWIARLREQTGAGFPENVTAFRSEMAVHGKYGKPCPVCGTPVQRIVYAENECNYCPQCQTGGKLLADRALSRLLKGDWPRTMEELEEMRATLSIHRNDAKTQRTAKGRKGNSDPQSM